jgi:ribosomal protein S18 acetylase RimI-like enzyme
VTSNDDDADAAPTSAGGLWIGPTEEAAYTQVTYVAPMHLQAWKDCYAKFVPEVRNNNSINAFGFLDKYKELKTKGYKMWLAKLAGAPIAVAIFGPDPKDPNRGRIEALYVAPEWRRHQDMHVGKRLLEAVLDELDYPVVVLDCATENEGGRSFWGDRGFRSIGEGDDESIPGDGDVNTVRYELKRGERSGS